MQNIPTPRSNKFLVYLLLALSDVSAIVVSVILALLIRRIFGPIVALEAYFQMWPLIILILVTFSSLGLYPAIGLSPANELRLLCYGISLVFLFLAGLTFIIRGGWEFSRAVFGLAWGFSFVLVPLARSITRSIGSRFEQWGIPIVVLTNSEKGYEVARQLLKNRKAGFRPIALLSTGAPRGDNDIPQGSLDLAPVLGRDFGLSHAILVFPFFSSSELGEVVDRHCRDYRHLLVVPSFLTGVHIWVTALDIGGNLGLEIKQNLLSPASQAAKRIFELVLSLILVVVLAPIVAILSLALFIESPGPVLFHQERIGKGGNPFMMTKFRTMIPGAESKLEEFLEADPALREEWSSHQKLTKDPRITRVGSWLRRWSLDELPQLFNVLSGKMSLVGPRPMTPGQESMYGRDFSLYSQVTPGMTGLWQISGRNLTTFSDRARFDSYYVRNWSIWLDFYILGKTPSAVLKREGAF